MNIVAKVFTIATALPLVAQLFDDAVKWVFDKGPQLQESQRYPDFRWILWGRRMSAAWCPEHPNVTLRMLPFVLVKLPVYDYQPIVHDDRYGWCQREIGWWGRGWRMWWQEVRR